ncbi:MAG: hypothetical protein JXA96_14290 [Sedimentisphaerales bacterium]|nr:hypothetical protein [Sedimentisphaerales bacterium]
MTNLPIILSEREDEIYGIIGRALAFATNFEINCKALQTVMEMKKRMGNRNTQELINFFENLEKQILNVRINKIIKELNHAVEPFASKDKEEFKTLNDYLKEKLVIARDARNEIAHDLGKGIENLIKNDEWREKLIQEVVEIVQQIAEADVMVYNLIQRLTNEPIFTGDYCQAAVEWVCYESKE